MQKDEGDLLEVLKFELEFLEKGGYGRSPRTPWRPTRIFQDSPTCLNFALPEKAHPCNECALMALVPDVARGDAAPCEHIPLNEAAETVESLSRYGSQQEMEEALGTWLRRTIQSIEANRAKQAQQQVNFQPPHFLAADNEAALELDGLRKIRHMFKKCANPLCITPFDPASGGMYFRFELAPNECCDGQKTCVHDGAGQVKHFWLCAHCRLVFKLVRQPGLGVMLQLLWPELAAENERKNLIPA